MKYSIYNNLIPFSDKHSLLYNSYSNMYILLRKELHNALLSISANDISLKDPSLYDQLIQAGCIVEDSKDEVKALQSRIKEIDNKNDEFYLTVNPTLNCNFKCWYCYEEHLPKSKMSSGTLAKVKAFITNTIEHQNLKIFHLGFFGGEPLLYYKDVVLPLLEHLAATCLQYDLAYRASFTTNGYLITEPMAEEMKNHCVTSLQITLDGNKENHNQTRYAFKGCDSYSQIIKNIKILLHLGISIVLRINYTHTNITSVSEIAEDLKDIPSDEKRLLNIDLQRVWQDKESNTFINPKTIKKSTAAFEDIDIPVTTNLIDQVWNSCYADKSNQALINYNGDIYKCTARDFNLENRLGHLKDNGDIEWELAKIKARSNIRFSKEICHSCRITPLCGGTCAQRILESGNNNVCLKNISEEEKDQIIY